MSDMFEEVPAILQAPPEVEVKPKTDTAGRTHNPPPEAPPSSAPALHKLAAVQNARRDAAQQRCEEIAAECDALMVTLSDYEKMMVRRLIK